MPSQEQKDEYAKSRAEEIADAQNSARWPVKESLGFSKASYDAYSAREREYAHHRAMDLVREYIDAHRKLYGEFPKFITLPSDMYRAVRPTEWIEFMYLNRPPLPLMIEDTNDPLSYQQPDITRIRIRLIEVDR